MLWHFESTESEEMRVLLGVSSFDTAIITYEKEPPYNTFLH